MKKLSMIDCFTGIGGFHLAGMRNGAIQTICTSEIDAYNVRLINQNLNLDNAGDINYVVVNEETHPAKSLLKEDLVPVEETGFSPLCIEDFYNDILPWPSILTGGFPCQDVSSANLQGGTGIKGLRSGLVHEQLRIMESLEIEIALFENSPNLTAKGLSFILSELDRLGYCVEWETISATAFGYPHYRHRIYLCAYLKDSDIFKSNVRIMDLVRAQAQEVPQWKLPLFHHDPEWIINNSVVENTRSIHLRTKRINSLGNSVIPDIPEAIFNAITDTKMMTGHLKGVTAKTMNEDATLRLTESGWTDVISDAVVLKMPRRGIMVDGIICSSKKRCEILDPLSTKYKGLSSTLIRKDGNNNFTTRSRLNRPGKLGGLIGDIMALGVSIGGLHPEFCEIYMGYEKGYTELKPIL